MATDRLGMIPPPTDKSPEGMIRYFTAVMRKINEYLSQVTTGIGLVDHTHDGSTGEGGQLDHGNANTSSSLLDDDHTQYVILDPTTDARNVINSDAVDRVPLAVKGFTGQTANLQRWLNSSSTILAYVSSGGIVTGTGLDAGADASDNRVRRVATPAVDNDATPKSYVDKFQWTNTSVTGTSYTASSTYPHIEADCSSNAITINLPAIGGANRFTIAKIDSTGRRVTVDGNGAETINGQTTALLQEQYEVLEIYDNGTEWRVV